MSLTRLTSASTDSFRAQFWMLVRDIHARYGWKSTALVVLMTVVAVIDGLGMVLLLPLLGAVGVAAPDGGGVAAAIDRGFATLGLSTSAYSIVAILLVILALQLLLFVAQQWWVSWLQRDYGACWQRELFDAFVHADWGFFAEQKLGNLTNLVAQETFRLSGAVLILLQLAAMLVAAIVYLAVALAISWQVTLLTAALGVALSFVARGIGRKNFLIGLRLGPLGAELNVLLTEFFGGAKLLKATATEDVAAARVAQVIEEMRVQHTLATFLPSVVRAIFEFSAFAALCFILVFGYRRLALPPASMLVVLALFVRLLPRFNALQQNVQLLATYLPAVSLVRQMRDTAEARSERHRDRAESADVPISGPLDVQIARGGYRGVTTLRDVALRFPEHGLVGIVGESGAGKSTLANCLLALAEVDGRLAFGGTSMSDVPLRVWRRQIGYVPQDTVLFHMSIRDNIAWGMPTATDQEIEQAARRAFAHDFILEQPQGYATIVGDQGGRLSGGQRQRLSIARALLRRPRLLLMDEATNALDGASEAYILETVTQLRRDICIVMVAHRLASVRNADLIVVLEKGTVVESGSWMDLLARQGALSRLAAAH